MDLSKYTRDELILASLALVDDLALERLSNADLPAVGGLSNLGLLAPAPVATPAISTLA
jgi:hypothetical protein